MRKIGLFGSCGLGLLVSAATLAACSAPRVLGKALPANAPYQRIAVSGPDGSNVLDVESALINQAGNRFTVLARKEQGALEVEKTLQVSGDFADEATVSLGQQLGAQLLVVVADHVERVERRDEPFLKDCTLGNSPGAFDTDADRAKKTSDRQSCEEANRLEVARAAAAPPHVLNTYKVNLKAIDVESGAVVAFGEAEMAEGTTGLTCDLPCTKRAAADLAVGALLGRAAAAP